MSQAIALDEQLHQIDLQHIERLEKLNVRLTTDLSNYKRYLSAHAIQEGHIDYEKVGLVEADPDADAKLDKIEELQIKTLLAMKSAVWSCSNELKRLHERRNAIRQEHNTQEE